MNKEKFIIIFAKPPLPGKTKSRLSKDIGTKKAAELSSAMLYDILKECKNVRTSQIILFHPDYANKSDFYTSIPDNINIIYEQQNGDNLGSKMSNAFKLLFTKYNAKKVILIGSDCISHSTKQLQNVFAYLATNQIIIQPAIDGGYVLVAKSQYCPEIFSDITWGNELVMNSTLSILKKINYQYKILELGFDIDSVNDFNMIANFLLQNTREKTKKLLSQEGFI